MGLNISGEYEPSIYCQSESQHFWWKRRWRPEPHPRPDHCIAFSCSDTVYHEIWAVMHPSFAMHFAFFVGVWQSQVLKKLSKLLPN